MNGKPTYVLGIGLSHDGSACLLKDGRICVGIEKERLTRRKHDGFNDSAIIEYCLDTAQISMSDLSLIVQNANFETLDGADDWFEGPRISAPNVRRVTISHHLAHAYSAVATSPFKESAVLIIDGCGNGMEECVDLEGAHIPEVPEPHIRHAYFEKDSYYYFDDKTITPLWKDFSAWGIGYKGNRLYPRTTQHSIGGLYAAVSTYVFNGIDDSGKLMGLAPYGKPGVYDFEIFSCRDQRVFVRYDWISRFNRPARNYSDFKAGFQYYADLAYHVQKEIERALLYLVGERYRMAPHKNLCYAGGVALNAVANRRILTEGPYENLYVQPAAGDNGLAVGCAFYGWMQVLGRERCEENESSSYGRVYSCCRIQRSVSKYEATCNVSTPVDVAAEAADMVVGGAVVGWFQGSCEFGPRALGNRSILADPCRIELRDYINAEIKLREEFRPFAPAVLAEEVSRYFEFEGSSPYMTMVVPVRREWQEQLAAVVHRDGTARIQTVIEASNPVFYRMLQALKQSTGIGVVLNTSMNRRGMPIVETPQQALEFFLESGLNALVIGNFIVKKDPARPAADGADLLKGVASRLCTAMMNMALNFDGHSTYHQGLLFNVRGTRTLSIEVAGHRATIGDSLPSEHVTSVVDLPIDEFIKLQHYTAADFRDAMAAGRISLSPIRETQDEVLASLFGEV